MASPSPKLALAALAFAPPRGPMRHSAKSVGPLHRNHTLGQGSPSRSTYTLLLCTGYSSETTRPSLCPKLTSRPTPYLVIVHCQDRRCRVSHRHLCDLPHCVSQLPICLLGIQSLPALHSDCPAPQLTTEHVTSRSSVIANILVCGNCAASGTIDVIAPSQPTSCHVCLQLFKRWESVDAKYPMSFCSTRPST